MENIQKILGDIGITIPKEQEEQFNAAFLKNYRTIAETENLHSQIDDLKTQNNDYANSLKELQTNNDDIDSLKAKITELQTNYDNAQKEYEAKLSKQQYESLVREKTSGIKFTSKQRGLHIKQSLFIMVENMQYGYKYKSPLGELTIRSGGEYITGLWIEGQKYFCSDELNYGNKKLFENVIKWLDIYFSGREPDFYVKIKPTRSEFRMKVWHKLLGIPYGSTRTYGDIAYELAMERGRVVSAQAVGGAVGHNPVSILIPCYRVIGKNKNMVGYSGGIDKKCYLLDLEKINL